MTTQATTAAADALVLENIALVGYHVNSMLGRLPAHVSRSELASAGYLALVQAARSFDAATGVPFARYAALRIRGAIVDELRGMDWISRSARRRVRRLNEVADVLTASLGRVPSREELAEALGVAVDEIDTARGDAEVRVLSMDGAEGAGAVTLATEELGPEEQVVQAERLRYLRAGIEALPERLRFVVEQIFLHDRPIVEIAEELGVTQSRISQLRSEALGLLKDGMNASLEPELVTAPAGRPGGVAERRRQAYFASVAARAASVGAVSTVTGVPTQRHAADDRAGERMLAVG